MAVTALTALSASGCERGEPADLVTIDGSSTVYPITAAAAEEYAIATDREARVIVGVSGTGGGFQRLCAGGIDTTLNPLNRPESGLYMIRLYPFHRLFNNNASFVFRPSWAPRGERLVFSNGLHLYIWSPDNGGEPRRIRGTLDAVWPAWSPDGEWIAYTRLERADSTALLDCERSLNGIPIAVSKRRDYIIGRHILTLIRPDGRERIELGLGNEPAWGPEGEMLYFRRDSMIWRMRVPDGEPEPVPFTLKGREPSISPDGNDLAFARRSDDGDYDIWVIELETGGSEG